ncbi:MAG TPA: glycosyltransferase [Chloroflexota bacterium]|nr:glycosyltransferase [Chloroflexota bacterium]
MKIGIVLPGFSAGADDWCIPALRNLAEQLARRDDARVVALRYPYRPGRYEAFAARVIALGGGRRRGPGSATLWRDALLTLAAEHRRARFDVLHAFWATESGFLTAIAGRVLGIPTVVSLAGGELVGFRDLGYGDQLRRAQRVQVAAALRLANVVTAGSTYLMDLARSRLRRLRGDRLLRAPLGVDTALFQSAFPPTHGWPRLVHVGSLVPVKDQSTLLAAVARLHAGGTRCLLDIAGSGPLAASLQFQAEELGIGRFVRLRGEVPQEQLPCFYQEGDLFVLSSRHEAQCVAALEAAACGLPIVGTAVGVIPELSPDASRAVAPGDPDALAETIATLLADPDCCREMGQAGRRRVEEEFTVGGCAEAFRRVYGQAVANSL